MFRTCALLSLIFLAVACESNAPLDQKVEQATSQEVLSPNLVRHGNFGFDPTSTGPKEVWGGWSSPYVILDEIGESTRAVFKASQPAARRTLWQGFKVTGNTPLRVTFARSYNPLAGSISYVRLVFRDAANAIVLDQRVYPDCQYRVLGDPVIYYTPTGTIRPLLSERCEAFITPPAATRGATVVLVAQTSAETVWFDDIYVGLL